VQIKTFSTARQLVNGGYLKMKISELRKILSERGVKSNTYSVEGPGLNDREYRLEKDGILWVTYGAERDERVGIREFLSEEDACRHFLDMLLKDPITRR